MTFAHSQKRLLEAAGYIVVIAADEVAMPYINGLELADRVLNTNTHAESAARTAE